MKKLLLICTILILVLGLTIASYAGAFSWSKQAGSPYVDANKNGICDNLESRSGVGFVNKNGTCGNCLAPGMKRAASQQGSGIQSCRQSCQRQGCCQ